MYIIGLFLSLSDINLKNACPLLGEVISLKDRKAETYNHFGVSQYIPNFPIIRN